MAAAPGPGGAETDVSAWLRALLLAVAAFNMIGNAFLPLHPDEAYYWLWSRHLALSYFDHPPLVAYVIRLFTLPGNGEFFVRLGAVAAMSGTAVLVYRLAREMFDTVTAETATMIFLFLPLTQAGYAVMTPDAPLGFFWALTLYLFYRGTLGGRTLMLYLAGVAAGLMLLSKYPGVLLLAALFLFVLFYRRRELARPPVYVAVALAVALFLPVLIWNGQHDWASFRFQFAHGVAAEHMLDVKALGLFVAGQFGVANPVFWTALLLLTGKNLRQTLRDARLALLFWPCAFTLLFFAYHAMFKEANPNWPAPAYISGSILLAHWLRTLRWRRGVLVAGVAVAVVLVIMVHLPGLFPFLPPGAVLKRQFDGNDVVFRQASRDVAAGVPVLSDSYQNAALAAYYLEGQPPVYIVTPTRPSQFDYWSRPGADQLSQAVFIGEGDDRAALAQVFARVVPADVIMYHSRYVSKTYRVYRCYGYKGSG